MTTGPISDVEEIVLTGLEAATVFGPLSFQAELVMAEVDSRSSGGDVDLTGYYINASYFLTGEHRPYDRTAGAFTRVIPNHNWRNDGHWGAWELAARVSNIDFNDKGLSESYRNELDAWSLGLNWYLNPNTRVMWNYIVTEVSTVSPSMVCGDGEGASTFGMRVQVDF